VIEVVTGLTDKEVDVGAMYDVVTGPSLNVVVVGSTFSDVVTGCKILDVVVFLVVECILCVVFISGTVVLFVDIFVFIDVTVVSLEVVFLGGSCRCYGSNRFSCCYISGFYCSGCGSIHVIYDVVI